MNGRVELKDEIPPRYKMMNLFLGTGSDLSQKLVKSRCKIILEEFLRCRLLVEF